MAVSRRDLLRTAGSAGLAAALAGCTDALTAPLPGDTTDADVAVAAEWTAIGARAGDAYALGLAGDASAGSAVAGATFARFEGAQGEHGAHEALEHTDETFYAEFEEALGELRDEGLGHPDLGRARTEVGLVHEQLLGAQRARVDEKTADAFHLQLLGAAAADAGFLAAAGAIDAARTTASDALTRFEEAPAHDALENADHETYETFEAALQSGATAANDGDAETAKTSAANAFDAAMTGAYAIADEYSAAGAGHLAALQARGWDAAALARLGGPGTGYADAAVLTTYRLRAADAAWLAVAGETDRAATVAADIYEDFEAARAHEGFEHADHDTYEAFEAGVALEAAAEANDLAAVLDAIETVDANLVTGIDTLAGTDTPPLEAAFVRGRLADAQERYRQGEGTIAGGIAQALYERFEADELGLHEAMEGQDHDRYEAFEAHLEGLAEAYEAGDDAAVDSHHDGAMAALLAFEVDLEDEAASGIAEAAYMDGRAFDAATVAAVGDDARAATIAHDAYEHFEEGAAGYHGAIEHAEHETYETLEARLEAIESAADAGGDVYAATREYDTIAVESVYTVAAAAGGSHREAAVAVVGDAYAHFEEARVHELLETADHDAYETFEARLETLGDAIETDGDVAGATAAFADAALYGQFAVAGAADVAPVSLEDSGGSDDYAADSADLSGGPNVVDGVPDDADHVVEMTAVAFEPAALTVAVGDTVAWTHAEGEPHTVTAAADGLPEGASYWASGGFEGYEAAEAGWEAGEGAVQSGQSFVHSFETTGTHEYVCIPHERAGMTGTVVVEE